jgi:hypothetical protein
MDVPNNSEKQSADFMAQGRPKAGTVPGDWNSGDLGHCPGEWTDTGSWDVQGRTKSVPAAVNYDPQLELPNLDGHL